MKSFLPLIPLLVLSSCGARVVAMPAELHQALVTAGVPPVDQQPSNSSTPMDVPGGVPAATGVADSAVAAVVGTEPDSTGVAPVVAPQPDSPDAPVSVPVSVPVVSQEPVREVRSPAEEATADPAAAESVAVEKVAEDVALVDASLDPEVERASVVIDAPVGSEVTYQLDGAAPVAAGLSFEVDDVSARDHVIEVTVFVPGAGSKEYKLEWDEKGTLPAVSEAMITVDKAATPDGKKKRKKTWKRTEFKKRDPRTSGKRKRKVKSEDQGDERREAEDYRIEVNREVKAKARTEKRNERNEKKQDDERAAKKVEIENTAKEKTAKEKEAASAQLEKELEKAAKDKESNAKKAAKDAADAAAKANESVKAAEQVAEKAKVAAEEAKKASEKAAEESVKVQAAKKAAEKASSEKAATESAKAKEKSNSKSENSNSKSNSSKDK